MLPADPLWLFATGIRVGEAASLDLGDCSPDDHTYRIRGKGGRARLAFLTQRPTIKIQQTYLQARRRLPSPSPTLFLNTTGRRLSTQGMSYALRALVDRAGLTKHVTPHMIRHTSATLLLRNGADLRMVQEFLGHASIVTTQRYTHVTKEHLVATLRRCHPGRRMKERRQASATAALPAPTGRRERRVRGAISSRTAG